MYERWLIFAYRRYDQRYGDSNSTTPGSDHDVLNIHNSNLVENDLLPDELGPAEYSGGQIGQARQIVEDDQGDLRQNHASQMQRGSSSADRPSLAQSLSLEATPNSPSDLTRSIPPEAWTLSMPVDFSSNSSATNYNAYHLSPESQLHNRMDLRPGNSYTTLHASSIVPQQALPSFEAHQTQWPSTVQCATSAAPSAAQLYFEGLQYTSPGLLCNRLNVSGSIQYGDYNTRMESEDPRPSTRYRKDQS